MLTDQQQWALRDALNGNSELSEITRKTMAATQRFNEMKAVGS